MEIWCLEMTPEIAVAGGNAHYQIQVADSKVEKPSDANRWTKQTTSSTSMFLSHRLWTFHPLFDAVGIIVTG